MIGISNSIFKANVKISDGASYDADAQAYFTANTSITSDADKTAINDFYLGLKTDGIYSKLKVMNLPIWGSASSSKWNLINPLDTDAAFRAVYSTGFTFSSGGMTGNGTSAYVDIFFTPNAVVTQNSFAYGFYSRTSRAGSNTINAMGIDQTTIRSRLNLRVGSGTAMTASINGSDNSTFAVSDSKGFYQVSRTASTSINRGVNTYTNVANNSTGINSIKFYVCAINQNGSVASYETAQCAFFYLANGLTIAEMDNFKTRVNTLMTYFGINV
jgi:hypothetical protein